MKPEEVLVSITIPFTKQRQYFKSYKQARRRDDDIAIVTCAFSVQLDETNHVTDAYLAFGGMAPLTVCCPTTQTFLRGQPWTRDILDQVFKHMENDLPLAPNAPGGMIQYRRSLTTSFFFKFFLEVLDKISQGSELSEKERSAYQMIERPLSRGEQCYQVSR
jgi:xanthine dehydrogenase/oxidase